MMMLRFKRKFRESREGKPTQHQMENNLKYNLITTKQYKERFNRITICTESGLSLKRSKT